MPPVFTNPPSPISANPPTTWQGGSNAGAGPIFSGPFIVGSNWYSVYYDLDDETLGVYKSTDSGATWTLMDAANQPGQADPLQINGYHVELNGTTLELIYCGPVSGVGIITYQGFDTGSDTFQTPDPSGEPVIGFLRVAKCPNGDYVTLFTDGFGGLVSMRRSGGIWAVPIIQFTGGTTLFIRSAVSDSSNVLRLFYDHRNGGTYTFNYRTLSAVDVISAATVLATSATASLYNVGVAKLLTSADCIEVPAVNVNATLYPASFGFGPPGVWVGTPIASPSWTFVPVDVAMTGLHVSVLPLNGTDSLVWWTDSPFLGPASLWYCTFDGTTMGTPIEYYDSNANPPPWGGGYAHQQSIALISAGVYGLTLVCGPNALGSAICLASGPSPGQSGYRHRAY